MSLLLIIFLFVAFLCLVIFPRTRKAGMILLGCVLALAIVGFWWLASIKLTPNPSDLGYRDYSQLINQRNAPNTVDVINPITQSNNYEVISEFNNFAQSVPEPQFDVPSGMPLSPAAAMTSNFNPGGITSWAIVLIALAGLLLVGGFVLTIVLIFNRKTRVLGISMLVAGPFILLLLAFGLFFSARTVVKENYMSRMNESATISTMPPNYVNTPPGRSIPLPPGYVAQQSTQQALHTQNSNKVAQSYQQVIDTYSQVKQQTVSPQNSNEVIKALQLAIDTLSRTLDKVSADENPNSPTGIVHTLKMKKPEIENIMFVQPPKLINVVGQALAKAVEQKAEENQSRQTIMVEADTISSSPLRAEAVKQPAAAGGTKNSPKKSKKPPVEKSPTEMVTAEISKSSNADQRPDWIDKPAYKWHEGSEIPDYYRVGSLKSRPQGEAYLVSVSTGPFSTRMECEANKPDVLQSAVNRYIEAYIGRQWVGWVRMSPEQLHQLIVAEWEETKDFSVGKMTEVHLLLNFDQKAKVAINEALNLQIFTNRAEEVGVPFLIFLSLLAAVWAYMKIDIVTKGAYRKHLRITVGLVILLFVGIMILAAVV